MKTKTKAPKTTAKATRTRTTKAKASRTKASPQASRTKASRAKARKATTPQERTVKTRLTVRAIEQHTKVARETQGRITIRDTYFGRLDAGIRLLPNGAEVLASFFLRKQFKNHRTGRAERLRLNLGAFPEVSIPDFRDAAADWVKHVASGRYLEHKHPYQMPDDEKDKFRR